MKTQNETGNNTCTGTTPSFYAIIPANVRYDKDLKPNAKLLYGEITALTSVDGYCWASNRYFAELYDVHQRTIIKWIEQLIDKEYIRVVIENVYKRKIFIPTRTKKAEGYGKKDIGGMVKKAGGYDKKGIGVWQKGQDIITTSTTSSITSNTTTINTKLKTEIEMNKSDLKEPTELIGQRPIEENKEPVTNTTNEKNDNPVCYYGDKKTVYRNDIVEYAKEFGLTEKEVNEFIKKSLPIAKNWKALAKVVFEGLKVKANEEQLKHIASTTSNIISKYRMQCNDNALEMVFDKLEGKVYDYMVKNRIHSAKELEQRLNSKIDFSDEGIKQHKFNYTYVCECIK